MQQVVQIFPENRHCIFLRKLVYSLGYNQEESQAPTVPALKLLLSLGQEFEVCTIRFSPPALFVGPNKNVRLNAVLCVIVKLLQGRRSVFDLRNVDHFLVRSMTYMHVVFMKNCSIKLEPIAWALPAQLASNLLGECPAISHSPARTTGKRLNLHSLSVIRKRDTFE